MADLVIYLPNHGYADEDPMIASWLTGQYYVADKTLNSFKLAATAGGTDYVQVSSTVTSGYVRKASTGSTTITGLDHLEDRDVAVVADGVYLGTFTVSGGSITLPTTAYSYRIGLPYTFKAKTTRLELPAQGTTLQSKIKKISEVSMRYLKTKGGQAGQEYGNTSYLTYLDTEFSDKSSDVSILTKGGYSPDGYIVIRSAEPYPMTVIAVMIAFEVMQ